MYYKLTDQNMQTYGGFQWELGKWYSIDKDIRATTNLCNYGWFHCYDDPYLAAAFNPAHAAIRGPRLFICNVCGSKKFDGTKFGFTFMRLREEIDVPALSLVSRVAFGILAAKTICKRKEWNRWADNWLEDTDRSYAAASDAASDAADAAASAATFAADAAAFAADAADAAADAAAYAADAAAFAADAAAFAADAASAGDLDLKAIIRKAMEIK